MRMLIAGFVETQDSGTPGYVGPDLDRNWTLCYNSLRVIEEGQAMSMIVAGFVKNGVVVPNAPNLLPEGAFVEVHVIHGPIEVPPELQVELDAWHLASADAMEVIERLEREGEDDAKR
jgi:hypothetical protein